ncbi:uncharacterized protein isoform X1 [Musca autumnalis]|uniref:uncharacterized protein isoform X1 n=1 Tax=Musca autumnalis TaxID=221902 RepID=UPI003CEB7683
MSQVFSIKTEPLASGYEQKDSTNDANTISCNITTFEKYANMINDIKEEKLDLDKMEEFLPDNVDNATIDIIKKENVDEMDEFLSEDSPSKEDLDEMDEVSPEDSPSIYSQSLFTWKSDDRTKVITHDEIQHQHLSDTTIQQISLPKLEIFDVYTDEDESKRPEINGDTDANVSANEERSQTATKYNCELCDCSFKVVKNLRTHMRTKHPLSIDTEYICKICYQKFTTQMGLDRHSVTMHPGAQTPTDHKCEICGSFFREAKKLRRHISDVHPSSIDIKNECEKCHKRFTTKIGLDTHSKMMHPAAEKPTEHKCELCGSCYRESKLLRAHIRYKHMSSTDSEYICEICHKRFTTQTGLDRHSYRMHPVAETSTKYKCEICGSCYKESTTLRTHIRDKHPSSTSYICGICNERFFTQTGLDRHYDWKHRLDETPETPTEHKCEICGRCFKEVVTLRRHIRDKHPLSLDTEYICEICHQRFTAQIGLDTHYFKKHPGVCTTQTSTKLSCEICGRYYTSGKTLREHIRKKHE